MEKARKFQKNICFTADAKAFNSVDHTKLWKILKEMGVPDQSTHPLRNLYVGQELTTPDIEQWTGSKLERSMSRLYIITLLFYAEYIM